MGFWNDVSDGAKAIFFVFLMLLIAAALYIGYQRSLGVQIEDANRAVYTHTQAYVNGAILDLSDLCREIDKNDDHKTVLQQTIRTRFVQLDANDVPAYLQACLNNARSAQ